MIDYIGGYPPTPKSGTNLKPLITVYFRTNSFTEFNRENKSHLSAKHLLTRVVSNKVVGNSFERYYSGNVARYKVSTLKPVPIQHRCTVVHLVALDFQLLV